MELFKRGDLTGVAPVGSASEPAATVKSVHKYDFVTHAWHTFKS